MPTTSPSFASTGASRGTGSRRDLLSLPGAAAFSTAASSGRVGVAAAGLGLVRLVTESGGSSATAGAVVGAFAAAEALVAPMVARLEDRWGQTRVLPWVLWGLEQGSAATATGLIAVSSGAALVGAWAHGLRRRQASPAVQLCCAAGVTVLGCAGAGVVSGLDDRALTWCSSAGAAGSAAAGALAGVLVDATGARGGFVLLTCVSTCSLLLALTGRRRLRRPTEHLATARRRRAAPAPVVVPADAVLPPPAGGLG